jgi:tetratricopeptide (TPR) repeat protein
VRRGEAWAKKGSASRSSRGEAAARGDFERAMADFNEAIRLDPRLARAFAGRGGAWAKQGNADRAIADFNQAIQLDPYDALALKARGAAFSYKGDNDRALVDLTRAIQLASILPGRLPTAELVLAYGSRSILYEVKGLYDRELTDLTRLFEICADPAVIEGFTRDWGPAGVAGFLSANYLRRAKLFVSKGASDQAIADYGKAVELDPEHAFAAYADRAKLEEIRGQREQAIADYRRAVAINPGLKEAADALARLAGSR